MSHSQIAFVLDEDIRDHRLWRACRRCVTALGHPLTVTRVGDPADLPRGTPDPQVLLWAEANSRILVSGDRRTMPGYFAAHLGAGRRSPGLFMLRPRWAIGSVVDLLALVTDEDNPPAWADRLEWIP